MAKSSKTEKKSPAEDTGGEKKAKSAKKMLAVAAVLTVVSLAGGFFFAKYALQKDAEAFEPEFVSEDQDEASHGEDSKDDGHGGDSHSTDSDDEVADDAHGDPSEEASTLGFLAFDDLTTNIRGFDLNGKPVRSFLKLSVVMVYSPEPEAEKLLKSRQAFTRDLFNAYIRSLTEADLRGGSGILVIKSELLRRARAAAGNELPTEILITDLIVN